MTPFIQIKITERHGGFRAVLYDHARGCGRCLVSRTLSALMDRIEQELAAYQRMRHAAA